MKKLLCLAMALLLACGAASAAGNDWASLRRDATQSLYLRLHVSYADGQYQLLADEDGRIATLFRDKAGLAAGADELLLPVDSDIFDDDDAWRLDGGWEDIFGENAFRRPNELSTAEAYIEMELFGEVYCLSAQGFALARVDMAASAADKLAVTNEAGAALFVACKRGFMQDATLAREVADNVEIEQLTGPEGDYALIAIRDGSGGLWFLLDGPLNDWDLHEQRVRDDDGYDEEWVLRVGAGSAIVIDD